MKRSDERRARDQGGGPDRGLVLLLLLAWIGGLTTAITGALSRGRTQVIAGVGLMVLSIVTLAHEVIRAGAGRAAFSWREAVYRWQHVIQLALVAVVFVTPPMAEEETLLDLAFDVSGGVGIVVGLLLRLWVAGQGERRMRLDRRWSARPMTSGPYAYMRQPVPLSTLLIAVGLVLLAESGPGLVVIPAVLIVMYAITIPLEEAQLSARFGATYADYCAQVPRFPRTTPAVVAAATRAMVGLGRTPGRAVMQDWPAVVTTVALTVLAETHEFFPHLFG